MILRPALLCVLLMNALFATGLDAAVTKKPHATTPATRKKSSAAPAHPGKAKPSARIGGPKKAISKGRSRGPAPKGRATKGKFAAMSKSHPSRGVPARTEARQTRAESLDGILASTVNAPFTYPANLRPLFTALAAEQAERAAGTPTHTVRMLQFGDSHTAADLFTGELRARLQAQFGDGGLGLQFPGHPFPGYHLAGSQRAQTAGWITEGNHFTALGDGDLGLGGISVATTQPAQTITLTTTCEALHLHFLRQESGGRLQFTDNATPISIIETGVAYEAGSGAGTSRAGTFTYACTPGSHDFSFTTLDAAPVKLLGVVTEQPGVTYECLGINGAVAPLILRWNQTLFAEYLRQRNPNLIVLAYGSNEAGISADGLATYPAEFAQILDTLHRNAPEAALLVLGPYDRAIAHVTLTGRGRRKRRSVTWSTLPGVDRIIAMQREACRTHACSFWDARRRMGGPGSIGRWIAAGWAQPDHTHLTGTGYHALADALATDLLSAYNLYQQSTGTAPSAP